MKDSVIVSAPDQASVPDQVWNRRLSIRCGSLSCCPYNIHRFPAAPSSASVFFLSVLHFFSNQKQTRNDKNDGKTILNQSKRCETDDAFFEAPSLLCGLIPEGKMW